jgi:hypothetical protein
MGLLKVLNFIPPQYKIFAYGAILLVIVTAVFWKGYGCAADKYQVKIDKLENEKAQYVMQKQELADRLLAKIGAITEVIVTKYVDRVKVIKEKETSSVDAANENTADKDTKLSSNWVCIHNAYINDTDAKQCNNTQTP